MQGGQVEASGGRKDYRSQAAEDGSWAWLSLDWNNERLPAHRPPQQNRRGTIHASLLKQKLETTRRIYEQRR